VPACPALYLRLYLIPTPGYLPLEWLVHPQQDLRMGCPAQSQLPPPHPAFEFGRLKDLIRHPPQRYTERIDSFLPAELQKSVRLFLFYPSCSSSNRSFTSATSLSPRPDKQMTIVSSAEVFSANLAA